MEIYSNNQATFDVNISNTIKITTALIQLFVLVYSPLGVK